MQHNSERSECTKVTCGIESAILLAVSNRCWIGTSKDFDDESQVIIQT